VNEEYISFNKTHFVFENLVTKNTKLFSWHRAAEQKDGALINKFFI